MIDPNLTTNVNSNQNSGEAQIPLPSSSPLDKPYFTFYSFHMLDDFQLPKYIKRGTYHKVELQNGEEDDVETEAEDDNDQNDNV